MKPKRTHPFFCRHGQWPTTSFTLALQDCGVGSVCRAMGWRALGEEKWDRINKIKEPFRMKLAFRSLFMAVVAILAFSAVAAGSASAHEWLLGSSPVTAATSVKTAPKLTLVWTNSEGLIGAEINCKMSEKYTVNTGGKGSITELGLTNCSLTDGSYECESELKSVKVMNFPWSTQIVELHGEVVPLWNELLSGTGRPGFQWECLSFGINNPFKCEGSYWGGLESESSIGVREFFVKKIGAELPGRCTGDFGEGNLWIRGENHLTAEGGKILSFR
jgi:hypothetical protein